MGLLGKHVGKNVGKNIVIFLSLVTAGFFVAWLRFRPYLGDEGRYTDGVRSYDVNAGDEVRYAVWDRPLPMAGEVNSDASERRPALSPDGRFLVFAVGERGLGADLYVAEVVDGRAIDPRPLAMLNTDADEWAPCFAAGALYFASDRLGTAGGLDLFRARYDHGLFEEPERLQGGINTPANETDPAPVPGSEGLVFASDRKHGRLSSFDLYLARPAPPTGTGPEGSTAWQVQPLDPLNSAFDERDPAFTVDGQNLFFASDRAGSLGGFDLFRSALGAEGWVPPQPLVGVNSERTERGPRPARNGFELLFSVEEIRPRAGTAGADLYRARSLELFRTPGRPVGWRDLLVLAALLVLALLAWLAKTWEHLEVLYKCLLLSFLIHLIMLWWFREVYPEGGEYELRGDSNRIRVRLVSNPSGPLASNAERGGRLEVARELEALPETERVATAEPVLESRATANEARLERAEGAEAGAPDRARDASPQGTDHPVAPVPLQTEAEVFKRMSGVAPALAVPAPATDQRQATPVEGVRRIEQDEAVVVQGATPEAWVQERSDAGAVLPRAPGGQPAAERRSPVASSSPVAVAQPRETIERLSGAAPPMAVEAGLPAAAPPTRPEEAVARTETGAASEALEAARTTPRAATLARAEGPAEDAGAPPRRAADELRRERDPVGLAQVPLDRGHSESFELMVGGPPALEVEVLGLGPRGERAPGDVARSPVDTALSDSAAPETFHGERAPGGAALPEAPLAGTVDQGPSERHVPRVAVVQPRDTVRRLDGQAPDLALTPGASAAPPERAEGQAHRGDLSSADPLAVAEAVLPAASPLDRAPDRGELEEGEAALPRPTPAGELPSERAVADLDHLDLDQSRGESFERISGQGQALEVEVAAAPPRQSRLVEEAARTATEAQAIADGATPGIGRVARAPEAADLGLAPRRGAASELPSVREQGEIELVRPPEIIERIRGEAPELSLDAGPTLTPKPREELAAVREEGAPDSLAGAPAAVPQVRGLDRAAADPAVEEDLLAGVGAALEERLPVALPSVDLEDRGREDLGPLLAGDAGPTDLLSDLSGAATGLPDPQQQHAADLEVARADLVSRWEEHELSPDGASSLRRAKRREDEPTFPGRRPIAQLPSEPRQASPEVELRSDLESTPGAGSAVRRGTLVARDAGLSRKLDDTMLSLATPATDRDRDREELRPQRFSPETEAEPALVEPEPTFRPLAAAERSGADDDRPSPTRWEHTPYRSRTAELKLKALELHGGSQETEAAVARGLLYLADKQKPNGYWGSAQDRHDKYGHVAVGKTGLALLAFLGAGHTQDSTSQHSQVVENAIKFLIAVQDEETGHFGYSTSYSHAIATYAMAECYALTRDQRLRKPLERAVRQIVRHQHKSPDARFHGGWGYYFPDGRTFDRWPRASVTAWQVMALESARLGKIHVEDGVFAGAKEFLLNAWDEKRSAFRYSHDPTRLGSSYDVLPGSTPASLFALSLLGERVASRKYGRARAFVLDRVPIRYRYTGDDDFVFKAQGNLYFYYYATLAMFRVGGPAWDRWNAGMKGALLPAQARDGSWRPISIYAREYAHDTDQDRTYTTAMCVLSLEIYYRYFTPLLKVE